MLGVIVVVVAVVPSFKPLDPKETLVVADVEGVVVVGRPKLNGWEVEEAAEVATVRLVEPG